MAVSQKHQIALLTQTNQMLSGNADALISELQQITRDRERYKIMWLELRREKQSHFQTPTIFKSVAECDVIA